LKKKKDDKNSETAYKVRNIRNIADIMPFWQDKRNNAIINCYTKPANKVN